MCVEVVCIFFFFKQKTAYEMRISDWSSDVCSSDLIRDDVVHMRIAFERHQLVDRDRSWHADAAEIVAFQVEQHDVLGTLLEVLAQHRTQRCEIGRASWRERVCQYV